MHAGLPASAGGQANKTAGYGVSAQTRVVTIIGPELIWAAAGGSEFVV